MRLRTAAGQRAGGAAGVGDPRRVAEHEVEAARRRDGGERRAPSRGPSSRPGVGVDPERRAVQRVAGHDAPPARPARRRRPPVPCGSADGHGVGVDAGRQPPVRRRIAPQPATRAARRPPAAASSTPAPQAGSQRRSASSAATGPLRAPRPRAAARARAPAGARRRPAASRTRRPRGALAVARRGRTSRRPGRPRDGARAAPRTRRPASSPRALRRARRQPGRGRARPASRARVAHDGVPATRRVAQRVPGGAGRREPAPRPRRAAPGSVRGGVRVARGIERGDGEVRRALAQRQGHAALDELDQLVADELAPPALTQRVLGRRRRRRPPTPGSAPARRAWRRAPVRCRRPSRARGGARRPAPRRRRRAA